MFGVCGIIADMKRVLTGLTAWLAGSVLAVSLAWFGAGIVVRNTAMSPAPPVITAEPAQPSGTAPASPDRAAASPSVAAGSHPAPTSALPSPSPSQSPSATNAAADGTVHAYTLTGGRVTLLIKPNSAELVTAIPAAGYSVQRWSSSQWLRVDFSSGAKVSWLIASWNGHAPTVTVTN